MKEMTYEYLVVYEESPQGWGATVPDLPGVFAVGDTREEVEGLLPRAIELHLDRMREKGQKIPTPHHNAGTVKVAA